MRWNRRTSESLDDAEDEARIAGEDFDAAGDLARPDLAPPSAQAFDRTNDLGIDGPR